ncbi:MAG: ROK family protein [Chthonomonadales bacterium]|nr:ROK family protein [Chthonomonadales bacterium]
MVDIAGALGASASQPPPLDTTFQPASVVGRAVRRGAVAEGGVPVRIAIERADGSVSLYETIAFAPGSPRFALNLPYIERVVKFLLWQRGGWRVFVGGPEPIGEHVRALYRAGGERAFDADFMGSVFEHPFTVEVVGADAVPVERETSMPLGRHLDGCRVGFDLGASDRKASAVVDGEAVFSEEVVWDPRGESDPEYHYQGVMDSIRRAAAHLPRLDAVGGSAAGVYIGNRVRVASLFRGIPRDMFEARIADMFLRIRDALGVPLEVVNDGEVTALAGSMSLGANPVLGLAMGSSQAAGYVNRAGNITGWLNELAFAPIDYRPGAPIDEWSGDAGCGVQYFSQVGAIRVAEGAGLRFGEGLTLPQKLEELQSRMAGGEPTVIQVYETLGTYLGYAMAHYAEFYDLAHVLVLGRVTSGRGGEVIVDACNRVLAREFPEVAERVCVALPDEKSRRVGQSIAAASLPSLGGSPARA